MLNSALIKELALRVGFDLVGVAPVQPARHANALTDWLNAGYHADMNWISNHTDLRSNPAVWWPQARSMVVIGVSYHIAPPPPDLWNDPMRGRIARYAWGRDYHKVIPKRLKALAAAISEIDSSVESQLFNDSRPVLEHDAALAAGLGFVGRNSLLIHPEWGSQFFLGGLLLSCDLEPDTATPGEGEHYPITGGKTASCGNCRRCLNHCPTHAFPAEYVVNSARCISYQTIENRNDIPDELRSKMGNWIFGCDACQEVCPWVKRYSRPSNSPWLENDPDRMCPRLDELAYLNDEGVLARFAGTPVMRTKRRGLLRNVAVALGNSGSADAQAPLEHLLADPEPVISSHAEWALKQLED